MTRRKHGHGRRLHSLYLWHRYIGLGAMLLVVVLALTGILLNHTDALRLGERYVYSSWLLRWYGIRPEAAWRCYAAGTAWACASGDVLTFNDRPIAGVDAALVGALAFAHLRVLAVPSGLLVLTPQGELIERIGAAQGLPTPIRRIGLSPGGALILDQGTHAYRADLDRLEWKQQTAAGVRWSVAQSAPPVLLEYLHAQHPTARISWERLLLDLHSGRWFGRYGNYVMDLAALLLLLLAVSGVIVYAQRRPRRRREK